MNSVDLKRRLLRWRPVRALRDCRELVRLWRSLSRSELVDPALYATQRGRRRATRPGAALHWLWAGASEGRVLGPLLVPPVAIGRGRGGRMARAAALRRAGFPRTAAHPLFDARWYAAQHPGAAGFRGGPLVHWLTVGRPAGAPTHPMVTPMVDLVAMGTAAVTGPADRPGAAEPARGADPVRMLAVMAEPWPSAHPLLRAADPSWRTLVVNQDDSPLGRLVGAALAHRPGLEVATGPLADAARLASAGPPQGAVIVASVPVEATREDLTALADALAGGGPDLAGPVVLDPGWTVAAAGLTATGAAMSAGQAPDDVHRSGGTVPVSTLPRDLFAVRRRLLATVLAAGTATGESATGGSVGAGAVGAPNTVLLRDVSVRRLPGVAYPPLAADPASAAPPRRLQVTEAAPRLRWAIKSAHPPGRAGLAWGDLHFARALAGALERAGQLAVVDPLPSWYRSSAEHDDVVLVLRGLHRYRPAPGQRSALWVISHPELVGAEELGQFDVVFAASASWASEHSRDGRVVHPLLQCTDASVFTPPAAAGPDGPSLLFVGNTRGTRRPLVEAALAAGLPLQVVGAGWHGRVPAEAILAEHVANADLPALYASAGIVLNDHWPHMAEQGFLSNRLFDLTAVGAPWVSDPARGMAEVFPDVARTATDPSTLRAIVTGAPGSLPDLATRLAASERIRREHSFDARAAALVAALAAPGHQVVGAYRP